MSHFAQKLICTFYSTLKIRLAKSEQKQNFWVGGFGLGLWPLLRKIKAAPLPALFVSVHNSGHALGVDVAKAAERKGRTGVVLTLQCQIHEVLQLIQQGVPERCCAGGRRGRRAGRGMTVRWWRQRADSAHQLGATHQVPAAQHPGGQELDKVGHRHQRQIPSVIKLLVTKANQYKQMMENAGEHAFTFSEPSSSMGALEIPP